MLCKCKHWANRNVIHQGNMNMVFLSLDQGLAHQGGVDPEAEAILQGIFKKFYFLNS